MKPGKTAHQILAWAALVLLLPHILLLRLGAARRLVLADLERWRRVMLLDGEGWLRPFIWLMTFHPEFRSLFYHRLGRAGKLLAFLSFFKPMPGLFIITREIGPGLFIQHGFSTIISAERIGSNCWVNQQVTIGYTDTDESPTLGDNVRVFAGAKVLGRIKLGENTTVGANAVVIRDVPANCTVVGVPARIVRRDGVRTKEAL